MLSYDNAAAIAAAPTNAPVDPVLRQLLADRVHDWAATDLLGLTHLLVAPAGTTEHDIFKEAGFSPLANSLDGSRFGDAGWLPQFDWLQRHPGWFELIQTVSNDGFAFSLWIEATDGTDPELRAMCEAFADYPPEAGGGQ